MNEANLYTNNNKDDHSNNIMCSFSYKNYKQDYNKNVTTVIEKTAFVYNITQIHKVKVMIKFND